jgi:hypothetical protein
MVVAVAAAAVAFAMSVDDEHAGRIVARPNSGKKTRETDQLFISPPRRDVAQAKGQHKEGTEASLGPRRHSIVL